jgi:hypothetical protein
VATRGAHLDVARVQPALLGGGILPPPAALALVLVGQHGLGAGLAADGDEPLRVQLVDRHLLHAQEVPHLRAADVGQRVVLDQAAGAALHALERRVHLRRRLGRRVGAEAAGVAEGLVLSAAAAAAPFDGGNRSTRPAGRAWRCLTASGCWQRLGGIVGVDRYRGAVFPTTNIC